MSCIKDLPTVMEIEKSIVVCVSRTFNFFCFLKRRVAAEPSTSLRLLLKEMEVNKTTAARGYGLQQFATSSNLKSSHHRPLYTYVYSEGLIVEIICEILAV